MNKNFNKVITVFIMLFILVSFVFRTLVVLGEFSFTRYPFVIYIFGIIALLLYIFSICFGINKLDKTDIIITLLAVFGLISTIFAYDTKTAIYGYFHRYEGLLSLYSYYALFLLSKNVISEYKEKIIYFIIISSVIPITFGFLQLIEFDGVYQNLLYIGSIFGNANFYSSYLLMVLSLVIGLYLYKDDKSILYIVGIMFFSFFLYTANSMSGIIGLGLVCLLVFLSKKKKKIIITALALLISFAGYTIFVEDDLLHDIFNTGKEAGVAATSLEISDELGTTRGYVWKEAISFVPRNIITGVGVDNFAYIDDGEAIKYLGTPFDKAHNDFLQVLTTQGVFALISLIMLYGYIIYRHIKYNKEIMNKIIFLAVTSYILQSFFNISVVSVASIFYIILGLLVTKKEVEKNEG